MGTVISITKGFNEDRHTNGYHNLMQTFKDAENMNHLNIGIACIKHFLEHGDISEEEAKELREAADKKEYELTHKVVVFKK